MSDASLPFGTKYWPSRKLVDLHSRSLADPEGFWAEQGRHLEWFKTWDRVLDWDPPFAHWFPGGQLNASYLCVDRHIRCARRSKFAIYWEGESGETRVFSYSTLYREVNRFAARSGEELQGGKLTRVSFPPFGVAQDRLRDEAIRS